MNYELAKELKDAGFSQEMGTGDRFITETESLRGETCKLPILEELIEACNTEGFVMGRHVESGWMATIYELTGRGSTPAEAVARLWLALNKK